MPDSDRQAMILTRNGRARLASFQRLSLRRIPMSPKLRHRQAAILVIAPVLVPVQRCRILPYLDQVRRLRRRTARRQRRALPWETSRRMPGQHAQQAYLIGYLIRRHQSITPPRLGYHRSSSMPSTSHDYRRWHARDCCYGLLVSLPWMTTTGASTWKSRLTSGRGSNAARSGRGTQRRRSSRCARSSTRRPRQSVMRCACSKTKGSCAATPAADTTSPCRDPVNDHRAGALRAHNGSQSPLTLTNICKRFLRSGHISECMRPAPFLEGPRYSKSGGAPLTRGRPGTALYDDHQVHGP